MASGGVRVARSLSGRRVLGGLGLREAGETGWLPHPGWSGGCGTLGNPRHSPPPPYPGRRVFLAAPRGDSPVAGPESARSPSIPV
jgi:hypothetical protein